MPFVAVSAMPPVQNVGYLYSFTVAARVLQPLYASTILRLFGEGTHPPPHPPCETVKL